MLSPTVSQFNISSHTVSLVYILFLFIALQPILFVSLIWLCSARYPSSQSASRDELLLKLSWETIRISEKLEVYSHSCLKGVLLQTLSVECVCVWGCVGVCVPGFVTFSGSFLYISGEKSPDPKWNILWVEGEGVCVYDTAQATEMNRSQSSVLIMIEIQTWVSYRETTLFPMDLTTNAAKL